MYSRLVDVGRSETSSPSFDHTSDYCKTLPWAGTVATGSHSGLKTFVGLSPSLLYTTVPHPAYRRLLAIYQSWIYNMQVIRLGSEDWNADFLLRSNAGIGGSTDGAMYGHACASSCVAVAAMNWVSQRFRTLAAPRSR